MSAKVTVLSSTENKLSKFRELHAKSPLAARVYALSEHPSKNETLLIETSAIKFGIITQTKNYGVSKTDKIYSRKKAEKKLWINGNKFYVHNSGKRFNSLRQMTYLDLVGEELKIMENRFSWIRFLRENRIPIVFNSVVKYKLFDLRKVLTHYYKVPYPICKSIHDFYRKNSHSFSHKEYKEWLKHVTNKENFNVELLHDVSIFRDSIDMAKKLNKAVNVSWSVRRLKEEHDKWFKQITDILYTECNRDLKISSIYLEFNEQIGGLLTTTKDLALEGRRMNHCVAGYADRVDYGSCAIFRFEGYTAEIRQDYNDKLRVEQFKGHSNCIPPEDVTLRLKEAIDLFNKAKVKKGQPELVYDEHPF